MYLFTYLIQKYDINHFIQLIYIYEYVRIYLCLSVSYNYSFFYDACDNLRIILIINTIAILFKLKIN